MLRASLVLGALALPCAAGPQSDLAPDDGEACAADITELSLEELMNVEVSVASRHEERLRSLPAAAYAISGDELRRAGFTNVQEALRMVPGFYVARWTSNMWDVTARGFSGGWANQLLVKIDGIDVYTPQQAGVWWHLQEIDLADVERIEIIRGPGASLWGANAVNGIVNVVMKSAHDTQGLQAHALFGDDERRGAVRWGGKLSENGAIRTYVVGSDHDPLVDLMGESLAWEDWRIGKAGFQADWDLEDGARARVLGNFYAAAIGEEYFVAFPAPPWFVYERDDTPKNGVNLLASFETPTDDGGSSQWSAWYTRDNQRQVDSTIQIDSADLEWQRRRPVGERQTLTYGLGFRYVASDLPGDFTYTFDPVADTNHVARAFAQDQIDFPAQDLRVTLAASAEHNGYTGFELQPTARAAWTPNERTTVWTAISRAVRTPSIEENSVVFNVPISLSGDFLVLMGNDDLEAERLWAYELGWRHQPTDELAFDLAAYFNDYDEILTLEDGTPFTQGGNNFYPLVYQNMGRAQGYGFEAAVDWTPTEGWRLRSAYSFQRQINTADSGSTDPSFEDEDEFSPRNQFNVRSYLDLGSDWELDTGIYYVDATPSVATNAYIRTDIRLGYSPCADWRFSVGVQNAFDDMHAEEKAYGAEVLRNFWFGLTWSR